MTDPAAGASLQRAVEVMNRLRSPGGCPWDAAQTSQSLAKYLVEETYEVLEAVETSDAVLLREELGDLLLQVLFHARIAEELPDGAAFGIDDVAADLVAKLVRRHPHVFGNGAAGDVEDVDDAWERNKIAEKNRTSVVDGVPLAQPALALAAKLVSRGRRAGLDDVPLDCLGRGSTHAPDFGGRFLALVDEAVAAGVDPETELRRAARAYRHALIAAEQPRNSKSPDR